MRLRILWLIVLEHGRYKMLQAHHCVELHEQRLYFQGPYTLVLGDDEMKANGVNVRPYGTDEENSMSLDDFTKGNIGTATLLKKYPMPNRMRYLLNNYIN